MLEKNHLRFLGGQDHSTKSWSGVGGQEQGSTRAQGAITFSRKKNIQSKVVIWLQMSCHFIKSFIILAFPRHALWSFTRNIIGYIHTWTQDVFSECVHMYVWIATGWVPFFPFRGMGVVEGEKNSTAFLLRLTNCQLNIMNKYCQ